MADTAMSPVSTSSVRLAICRPAVTSGPVSPLNCTSTDTRWPSAEKP